MTSQSGQTEKERAYVLRLLSSLEYSRAELTVKLKHRKRIDDDLIKALLDDIQTSGWQSDERFAMQFARRRAEGGFGPDRIRMELHYRGIGPEVTEQALAQPFQWQEQATRLVEKKSRNLDLSDAKNRAKIYRYLSSKGFPADIVRRSIEMPDCH